ncbi:LolA family protein [Parasphingorhabdus flavimaris]|jgi:outer membrane lipoprotein-sorting protein|uniref:Outer membrane lipoprotein carrier protein LolA n=1 Tax=Parasphingorhabdus flavimaris TaxID=266812 RepID=A0ABX2MYS1_9SPHN|nr:outer membrane lipoprotein carrier protein LolA [Parasphingorhabdus flavimaris]NVD26496.1 outer membrane lipoprotein carrier protein LolA [Parasphingorhabdus flavimaris]|tara:strand:- start:17785 stop:18414 length:630 start_codon:yes stop_codon:yes gene_type:complete
MLKYGFALIAAPLALTASLPATAQQSPADSLSKISNHLRSMSTMTANFSQTDRSGQLLTGTLTLKQPGKIRFQYQKDANLLIVGDGKALTLIDYEVNQVQRWPISNSPLAALLNPERDLSKYGKIVPTRNPNVLSVEVNDPKRPEYGVITMVFSKKAGAPGGLALDGWVSLDSKNNRTSIRLSNQKFGVPVSNSNFNWTDPRKKSRGKR